MLLICNLKCLLIRVCNMQILSSSLLQYLLCYSLFTLAEYWHEDQGGAHNEYLNI